MHKVLFNTLPFHILFNMPACVSNGDIVLNGSHSGKSISTFNPFGSLRVNVSSVSFRKKAGKKIAKKVSSSKKKIVKKVEIPNIDIVFAEEKNGCFPTKMSLTDIEHYLALPKNWFRHYDDENFNTYSEIDDLYDMVIRFGEERSSEAEMIIDWLCNSEKIDLGEYEDPHVLQDLLSKCPNKGIEYLSEFDTLYD